MASKLTKPEIEQVQHSKWSDICAHFVTYWYMYVSGITIVVAAVFFMIHQYYSTASAIDGSLWGEYGDFVGGLLGALLGVVSVYYLIKTLREQQQANDIIAKSNNKNAETFRLQQFDSNFKTLLQLYHESILAYEYSDVSGKHAMISLAKQLGENSIQSCTNYGEAVNSASQKYDDIFYIPQRDIAAVHFRTLYQLFELITSSNISEYDKVTYAKMMRSQLCEAELLLLRYNCHCSYGQKMQTHINKYNLLKHLPLMSLLEFSKWRNIFNDDKPKINRLDTEFIRWRKAIYNVHLSQLPEEKRKFFEYSSKYELSIENADSKHSKVSIKKTNEDVQVSDSSLAKVFDCLTETQLIGIISAFLHEVYVYSNFSKFNQKEKLKIEYSKATNKKENAPQSTTYTWEITSDEHIIVSTAQLENP